MAQDLNNDIEFLREMKRLAEDIGNRPDSTKLEQLTTMIKDCCENWKRS